MKDNYSRGEVLFSVLCAIILGFIFGLAWASGGHDRVYSSVDSAPRGPQEVEVGVLEAAPTPTPTVTRSTVRASPKPASREARSIPAWAIAFQKCVINHESASAGKYAAENPVSSASGAYQFLDGTWQHYARPLGYRYTHASDAPPAVQDAVFFSVVLKRHFYHWKGTGCGYGT